MALDVKNDSVFVSSGEKDDGRECKEPMQADEISLQKHFPVLSLPNHSDVTTNGSSNHPAGSKQPEGDYDTKEKPAGYQDCKPTLYIDNPLSSSERRIVLSTSSSVADADSGSGVGVGVAAPELVSTHTRTHSSGSIETTGPVPQMTSTPIPLATRGGKGPVGSNSTLGATASSLSATPSTSSISTPNRPQSLSVRLKATPERCIEAAGASLLGDDITNSDAINTSFTSQTSTHTTTHESQTDLDLYDQLQVPIIGYETMEERSRFTVFKVRVQKSADEGWHIFRRYSDFVRLNDILKEVFPHFRLALPPKKWFGDNYERHFLDDRLLGLQAFLNNIISHRDVCNSEHVRDFLCVDDPPGAYDSLEESRAMCELLEDQVRTLREDVATRDARINLLDEELSLYKAEVDNLRRALRVERALSTHRRHSPSSQRSDGSITEQDEACSEAEADQGRHKPSSTVTSPESASMYGWDTASENLKPGRNSNAKVTLGSATSADVIATETSSGIPASSVTSVTPDMTSVASDPTLVGSVVVPDVMLSAVPGMTSVIQDMTSVRMNGLGAMAVLTPDKTRSATVP